MRILPAVLVTWAFVASILVSVALLQCIEPVEISSFEFDTDNASFVVREFDNGKFTIEAINPFE